MIDFLKWCLSDFWRFAGLVVLVAIPAQVIGAVALALIQTLRR